MVRRYLKTVLREQNISFEEDRNSFVIDCAGNDYNFLKVISIINERMEKWTYDLHLILNIKIDTGYEKVIIEYWED